MIVCGQYNEEDGICGFDDIICMEDECPYGLYDEEESDQDDMLNHQRIDC